MSKKKKKKTGHIKKLASNKKSIISVQSLWNLVKMIDSWDNSYHQVSGILDKNCGFFINGLFLSMSCFSFCSKILEHEQISWYKMLTMLYKLYLLTESRSSHDITPNCHYDLVQLQKVYLVEHRLIWIEYVA